MRTDPDFDEANGGEPVKEQRLPVISRPTESEIER